jgi:hypothetical protein
MTDFATMTNPELNRWAAERDNDDMWLRGTDTDGSEVVLSPNYAESTDAAIALLGRWGYEWERAIWADSPPVITVSGDVGVFCCDESPDCDTARALVIAACGLKESDEG